MEIFLTLVSAASFAAFILCFALVFPRPAGERCAEASPLFCCAPRGFARLSALCSLAAFYFVPVGSLPPFIDFEFGGFIVVALLIASALLDMLRGAPRFGSAAKALSFPAAFCFAWALLALFVSRAGVPGALGSLGTYSVMPLWRAAGVWGRVGMVCLFILLLCLFPNAARARVGTRRSSEDLAAALRASLCAALVAALLLPWNLSEFIAAGEFYAFFLDFIFFWIKASAVGCAATFAPRAAVQLTRRRALLLYTALIICSAFCIFIEARIF